MIFAIKRRTLKEMKILVGPRLKIQSKTARASGMYKTHISKQVMLSVHVLKYLNVESYKTTTRSLSIFESMGN